MKPNKKVVGKDGFTMSVQAIKFLPCTRAEHKGLLSTCLIAKDQ